MKEEPLSYDDIPGSPYSPKSPSSPLADNVQQEECCDERTKLIVDPYRLEII